MTITLARLDPAGVDRAALIEFLTTNTFPHHTQPQPTVQDVERRIAAGAYRDDDNATFWLVHAEHGRIGVFRFEDLEDGAPLFDLRLGSPFRGRGFGAATGRRAGSPPSNGTTCRLLRGAEMSEHRAWSATS